MVYILLEGLKRTKICLRDGRERRELPEKWRLASRAEGRMEGRLHANGQCKDVKTQGKRLDKTVDKVEVIEC